MGENIVGRTTKTPGILLLTLFVMSVAVVPASARMNLDLPKHDVQEYIEGYYKGSKEGRLYGYSYELVSKLPPIPMN